jgi:hypothetical protein
VNTRANRTRSRNVGAKIGRQIRSMVCRRPPEELQHAEQENRDQNRSPAISTPFQVVSFVSPKSPPLGFSFHFCTWTRPKYDAVSKPPNSQVLDQATPKSGIGRLIMGINAKAGNCKCLDLDLDCDVAHGG